MAKKALELLDNNDQVLYNVASEYLEQMGSEVSLSANLDANWYERWKKIGQELFGPVIFGVILQGSFATQNALPDYELDFFEFMENQASVFADSYTFELIKGITETTRKNLQKIFAQALEEGLGDDDIAEKLLPWFGERRSKLIAINESTRAWNAGAELAADELRNQGLQLATIWRTINDGNVDDICRELEGTPRGTAWTELPPDGSHIGCRCFVSHEVLRDDTGNN